MNLLDEIIERKRREVKLRREKIPLSELFKSRYFDTPMQSISAAISEGTGIVAEFKRKSPSAGIIGKNKALDQVLSEYEKHKVSAISILTDEHYFGGSLNDLREARNTVNIPILRKDFIVDEYQIFEAKANGADAILLIAEALDDYHATYLSTIANSIGLEVLMEFHSAEELYKLNENVNVIGINNRNLKTLKTDVRTGFDLIKHLPYDSVKIAESGISSTYEIQELTKAGFNGFLIGESLLKNNGLLLDLNNAITGFKNGRYAS